MVKKRQDPNSSKYFGQQTANQEAQTPENDKSFNERGESPLQEVSPSPPEMIDLSDHSTDSSEERDDHKELAGFTITTKKVPDKAPDKVERKRDAKLSSPNSIKKEPKYQVSGRREEMGNPDQFA